MSAPAIALTDPSAVGLDLDLDPPAGTGVSEADYWAYYYEHENAYEWNDGYLEVKPVSDTLTIQVYQWLLRLLHYYLDTHDNARLTALEMGFRLSLPDKVAIRKPDLGVVLDSNPIPLADLDRSYKGTLDLCVEALSDSTPAEIARDTEQKRREYEAAGVREYYILHHEPSWQRFYRRNAFGLYQPIPADEGVLQSEVVPGLRFRLEDLQRQPGPATMIEDAVYAPFVLPAWQRDRQVLEDERRARQQAEQGRQQAEQARQQAEQLVRRERAEKEALLAELARLRGDS
ncbi:Uma2 family endonuclease [Lamprobacter modestohalophilus]|uniref:Uma2 family endonuclease n=1 Tax=Lamprobacter modestohalophilus TaxID=1064514 RepID=UPI002ADECFE8|nr:Uma2 family endonuclease [Lamprobacter modestohalophilus]MEA1051354.1 Uma2 family endonuclease [Lamprobacter modestohalophilus]